MYEVCDSAGIRILDPSLEIGADYVLGVWSDDLGVETIRLYQVEMPERGQPDSVEGVPDRISGPIG